MSHCHMIFLKVIFKIWKQDLTSVNVLNLFKSLRLLGGFISKHRF